MHRADTQKKRIERLANYDLVDLLVGVLFCVLLLFTTVMSRQDFSAQEVTTFSRGLSELRECSSSSSVWKKISLKLESNPEGEQLFRDRCYSPAVHLPLQPTGVNESIKPQQIWQISRAKVALLAERVALSRCLRLFASLQRDVGGESSPTRKELSFTHMWTGF